MRCGNNKIFADHFANASRSATYKSKTMQNEIIKICEAMITEHLSSEVKSAKYFSVLADEATDIINIEQMSIVLRFVDQASLVREEFLGFVACDECLRGDAIARKVLTAAENLGLDMSNCHGQGYDCAANMSGKCSGAATIISTAISTSTLCPLQISCSESCCCICVLSPSCSKYDDPHQVCKCFLQCTPKAFSVVNTNDPRDFAYCPS